jgi:hypothetical protein
MRKSRTTETWDRAKIMRVTRTKIVQPELCPGGRPRVASAGIVQITSWDAI